MPTYINSTFGSYLTERYREFIQQERQATAMPSFTAGRVRNTMTVLGVPVTLYTHQMFEFVVRNEPDLHGGAYGVSLQASHRRERYHIHRQLMSHEVCAAVGRNELEDLLQRTVNEMAEQLLTVVNRRIRQDRYTWVTMDELDALSYVNPLKQNTDTGENEMTNEDFKKATGYNRGMFISEQYYEHEYHGRTHNKPYLRAMGDVAGAYRYFNGDAHADNDLLALSNGLSSYCYEIKQATHNLRARAKVHYSDWEREQRDRAIRRDAIRANLRANMVAATAAPRSRHTFINNYRPGIDSRVAFAASLRNRKALLANLNETVKAVLHKDEYDENDFDDWSDLISTLNDAGGCGYVKRSTIDRIVEVMSEGNDEFSDNVTKCTDCQEYCDPDDMQGVHNRRADYSDSLACNLCIEDHYTYSECMDTYVHENDCVSIYDTIRDYHRDQPSDYATSRYASLNFYYSERADAYFEDDWVRDEYDDEESHNDGLSSYHSSSRAAFFEEVAEDKNHPALGVELEVYANDSRYSTVRGIRENYPKSVLILEEDGSLDGECGFEIVTRPYGRKEWEDFAPPLLKRLRNLDVVGFNAPDDHDYGIHVNIHRRWFSPLAEARIMMLLCAEDNKNFVRAVAQRYDIYDANVSIGGLEETQQRIRAIGGLGAHTETKRDANGNFVRTKAKIYGPGRYCPVNWKDNVAEFRLFCSTINTSSFMKNLEFVWALYKWTLPESATGSSWQYRDFLTWLNKPENRKEYPHLVKYLSKSQFPLFGDASPVVSEWQDLMTKPVEERHVETE